MVLNNNNSLTLLLLLIYKLIQNHNVLPVCFTSMFYQYRLLNKCSWNITHILKSNNQAVIKDFVNKGVFLVAIEYWMAFTTVILLIGVTLYHKLLRYSYRKQCSWLKINAISTKSSEEPSNSGETIIIVWRL